MEDIVKALEILTEAVEKITETVKRQNQTASEPSDEEKPVGPPNHELKEGDASYANDKRRKSALQ